MGKIYQLEEFFFRQFLKIALQVICEFLDVAYNELNESNKSNTLRFILKPGEPYARRSDSPNTHRGSH